MSKVLIACEESQTVCKEFRSLGHEAYSCDILPCSGEHPEWHIQGDVVPLLKTSWDMIICFPPCTDICCSGARHFQKKKEDGRQQKGIDFFLEFTKLQCPWAIENPVGIMSRLYRKPDQIIQPWMFGEEFQKTTCLWLNGLPKLVPTNIVGHGNFVTFKSGKRHPAWYASALSLPKEERARIRSKTFIGVARAMATQWGAYVR